MSGSDMFIRILCGAHLMEVFSALQLKGPF